MTEEGQEVVLPAGKAEVEQLAERVGEVYDETRACTRLYLGPGQHVGNDSTWDVFLADSDRNQPDQVGTIKTRWWEGSAYRADFEGELLGTGFTVTARTIKSVLLHLSIEAARQISGRAYR